HRDLVDAGPARPLERAERVVRAQPHRPIDVVLAGNTVTEGAVRLVDDRQHDALGDARGVDPALAGAARAAGAAGESGRRTGRLGLHVAIEALAGLSTEPPRGDKLLLDRRWPES